MSTEQKLVAGVRQRLCASSQAGIARRDTHRSSRDLAAGRHQTQSSRPFSRTRAKNLILEFTHTSPCNAEEALTPAGTDPNAGTYPVLLPCQILHPTSFSHIAMHEAARFADILMPPALQHRQLT